MSPLEISGTNDSLPTLTHEQRQLLQQQTIDETTPGTIVRDFQTILYFVTTKGIEVSEVRNFFTRKHLHQLNEILSHAIEMDLKCPGQKSYPYIHGLYWLLRASGMSKIHGKGKKRTLIIDRASLECWNRLNSTERYFNLLEIWIFFSREKVVQQVSFAMDNNLRSCLHFLLHLPAQGKDFTELTDFSQIAYFPGLYNLAILDLFGFISVTSAKTNQGKWQVGTVTPNPVGIAMLQLLEFACHQKGLFVEDDERLNIEFGQFKHAFQDFFPEWQQNLVLAPGSKFRDRLYIFKVSFGKVWRRIAIPGKLTLSFLANGILDSVDFSPDDRSYKFTYQNRFGRIVNINSFYTYSEAFVDDLRVGDLPLEPGANMTYLFDCQNQWQDLYRWEFKVQLEDIKPMNHKISQPKILKKRGESPQQYPHRNESE